MSLAHMQNNYVYVAGIWGGGELKCCQIFVDMVKKAT